MRVSFYTLGCKVNQAETRAIQEQFQALGFAITSFTEPADIIVINTCSVTHIAERKARNIIRRSISQNPQAKVFVCGCYSNLEMEKLKKEIPEVAAFIPQSIKQKISQWNIPIVLEKISSVSKLRKKQFLKIQDGCNNFCSYCIIPYARPKLSSAPLSEVLTEAQKLILLGVQELVVTGINVGKYADGNNKLIDVLNALDNLQDLQRISLSSIEPECVTAELIATLKNSKKIVPHLHIPLQSGSDHILKLMNRKYTLAGYQKIIENLRRAIPQIRITSDIIVGFPGESAETFNQTLQAVKNFEFADIHIFRYSPRPNTKASAMQNTLSIKECDQFIDELTLIKEKLN